MKAVVTGCCGLVGFHLTEKLLSLGYAIHGIDDLSTGSLQNLKRLQNSSGFSFTKASVESEWLPTAQQIKSSPSLIFHLASPACPDYFYENGLKTMLSNSFGLWNMLHIADHFHARLIFASTSEIYGDPEVSPQPESYWGHVNSYGARSCYDESKRFGETLIYNWNKEKGSKHGLVRIFNTYGPRMNPNDQRVIHQFFKKAQQQQPLILHGDGLQTRSFCFVDDLIDGLLKYANSPHTQPVNLGTDQEITILDLAKKILTLFDQSFSQIQFAGKRKDDPLQRKPDITRAKEWLGWSPKVHLDEGLKRMKNDLSHQESSLSNLSNTL